MTQDFCTSGIHQLLALEVTFLSVSHQFSCCGYSCDAKNKGLGFTVALPLLEQKVLFLNVLSALQASGALRGTEEGWGWSSINTPTLHLATMSLSPQKVLGE